MLVLGALFLYYVVLDSSRLIGASLISQSIVTAHLEKNIRISTPSFLFLFSVRTKDRKHHILIELIATLLHFQ